MNLGISRVVRRRPEDLRRKWRTRSASCSFPMSGWDDPTNAVLIDALWCGDDPLPALVDVARARHEAGFTFNECAVDVRNLLDVLPRPLARDLEPFGAVVAIGDVFLDASYRDSSPTSSGLPDHTYLQERIRETYRPAGRWPPWVLAAVCLDPTPDRFDAMLRQLEVVPILQRTFASAATLCALSEDCFVALISDRAEASASCERSEAAVATIGVSVQWRVTALPEDPAGIDSVLQFLRRGS